MKQRRSDNIEDNIIHSKSIDVYIYDVPRTYFTEAERISRRDKNKLVKEAEEKHRYIDQMYESVKPTSNNFGDYIKYALILEYPHVTRKTSENHFKLAETYIYNSAIDINLENLTLELIENYLRGLLEKYVKTTVSSICDIIKKAIKAANDLSATNLDPNKIDFKKIAGSGKATYEQSVYVLNDREYQKLLDFFSDEKVAASTSSKIILFSLYTGIKIKFSINAKYSDLIFNYVENTASEDKSYVRMPVAIMVEGKRVPLPKKCSEWIYRDLSRGRLNAPFETEERDDISISRYTYDYKKDLPMFLSRTGRKLAQTQIFAKLYKASSALGLPRGIDGYSLQLSYAYKAVNLGMSLDEVSQLIASDGRDVFKFKRDFYKYKPKDF